MAGGVSRNRVLLHEMTTLPPAIFHGVKTTVSNLHMYTSTYSVYTFFFSPVEKTGNKKRERRVIGVIACPPALHRFMSRQASSR